MNSENQRNTIMRKALRLSVTALLFCTAMGTSAAAQVSLPAQFTGTAIGQAGPAAGKSADVNIYMNGTTSDEQAAEFRAILKNQGQGALVSAFEKAKEIGRAAIVGSTGTDFVFIRVHPDPNGTGGARIVMATNRNMSFGELYNQPITTQYPIAIITLNLDNTGKGMGYVYPACKVKIKDNELEVENYGIKPFRLVNVRVAKSGGNK